MCVCMRAHVLYSCGCMRVLGRGCVSACACDCVHACTCMCLCVHALAHVRIGLRACARACACVCVHVLMRAHVFVHVRVLVHVHVFVQDCFTHGRVHACVRDVKSPCACACHCAHLHVGLHVRMRACACVHAWCVRVRACVCIHVPRHHLPRTTSATLHVIAALLTAPLSVSCTSQVRPGIITKDNKGRVKCIHLCF